MKISELIKELQDVLIKYGDIEVHVLDYDSEASWYTAANEVLVCNYCLGTEYERTVVEIRS
jgi:hypothetical protein